MTRRRPSTAAMLAAAGAVGLLVLTGCGSSEPAATGTTGTTVASSSAATSQAATSGDATSEASSEASSEAEPSEASSESATADSTAAATSGGGALGAECTPDALETATPGMLTIATSEPVFEPWMVDNDPSNGQGYESAVAYGVAEQLGYANDQVEWVRVNFDEALNNQVGWDFDINQFTITEERAEVVDFSSGYYDLTQTVITVGGSPIEGATTVAELKDAQLGAMNGTTSLQAINDVVQPTNRPSVFRDNTLAVQALQNGQIAGLVVDLPTAFYMVGAQLDDGKIVGQLPNTADENEQLGLLLAKDSPLTACVTKAVDALRADGSLEEFEATWLASDDSAPVLS